MITQTDIIASGLFDAEWYSAKYRDVRLSGIDPAEHFFRIGMHIGRNPGPEFDTTRYLAAHPDVAASDIPPFVHFLRNRTPGSAAVVRPARAGAGNPVFRSGADSFFLRGLDPMARCAVLINATDAASWMIAVDVLFWLDMEHDVFVLGGTEIETAGYPKNTVSVTIVGPGDAPGGAAAFARLVASNVFDGYDGLLWLDPQQSGDDALNRIAAGGRAFCDAPDCGLQAAQVTSMAAMASDTRLMTSLKTALPRLGIRRSDWDVAMPVGPAVWIDPLLLRGLAVTARPPELSPDTADKGFPGRRTVLGLLAVFAAEAGMQVSAVDGAPAPVPVPAQVRKVKTVAFYLPQFHPIPENDLWWGKGFTEWTNVNRGKQLFRSHYQPRVPTELGYYDLRLEDTQVAQADLARDFGVHGFCYYYYWFDGKKLLNHPIEQMAKSTRTDAGFCVCWANENWSRNWDGQNRHVLMQQTYSMDSNMALIRELIPMMKDPRWIRQNGKPVMMVYRISIIPNWMETASAWREECRKAGLGEIHLCAVRFGLENLEGNPGEHGLDSYVLFPPHEARRADMRDKVLDLHGNFGGEVFDYTAVVDGDLEVFDDGYKWPVHRGTMLGWDNTARRLTDARIFHGATPYGFRRWMKGLLEQEVRHAPEGDTGDESLVFVNAWNEWAEGTYLEPDQRWGRAYLRAIASASAAVGGIEQAVLPQGVAAQPRGAAALERIGNPLSGPRSAALNPPAFYTGARKANPDWPTVMLCAHVSGHQLFGGERSLLDVLGGLAKLPLNVVVTAPSDNNRAYIDMLAGLSTGVYAFAYPQWRDRRGSYGWLTNMFADIIARHAVDVVHANTIVLVEPLTAATRMGRTRVIHSREIISLDELLRDRIGLATGDIIRQVFDRCDWMIGNSRATCDLFAMGDRTLYVPNAVSADDFDMGNKFGNGIKFGIISSNIPIKGVVDFVEVARRCAGSVPRARFVVIGPKTPQIDAWEAEIKGGTRPDNIVFAGYRDPPRSAVAEMNVLLNLSYFAESFGRTVAEALAARRPVIAYDWGALPELIQHGTTGWLVPYRDIDGVVAAVRDACDNSDRIVAMGEAGRSFIRDNFVLDTLDRAVADAYGRILPGLAQEMAPDTVKTDTATTDAVTADVAIPDAMATDSVIAAALATSPDTVADGGAEGAPTAAGAGAVIQAGPVPATMPATAARRIGIAPRTTIVIPVYNAPDEVRDCLTSILKHTDLATNTVLVVDDCSPDPDVAIMLADYGDIPGLTISRNATNIGYTRTINAGITQAGSDDVVLLNSDTIVTPKWLEGLRAVAYSRPKVATVTAMSDNAGAFSFPDFNAFCPKPAHTTHDEYALAMLQATRDCTPPQVPTGSGFCMFIRRALIDECGLFDHDGFPRGYGEENDFCMRAGAAGWVSLVSPHSFVYHVRTASFKGEKTALVKAGVDVVTRRYPDYAAQVKAAFGAPDMIALRRAAADALDPT